jgi:predicted nucleic acid-binding protein
MTERTYTETEVKALIAAALQRAVDVADAYEHGAEERNWRDGVQQARRIGKAILDLIPTDHAAALEAGKAQAREEAYANGMRDALAVACSLGYGGSPDVDRGHQEACDAICAFIAAWETAAIRAGKVQP